MTFVLTAGEIDLSIGSIVAVAALLAAVALRDMPWPVGVARSASARARRSARSTARSSPTRACRRFWSRSATMGVFAGIGRRLTAI